MIGPAVLLDFMGDISKKKHKDYRVSSGVFVKNRGGYTLEMRHRRCRASSAEGARIEAPKAPRGVRFLGRGCPPPQLTRGSGEHQELPQWGPGRSPGRQRILGIFQRLKSLLVEGF